MTPPPSLFSDPANVIAWLFAISLSPILVFLVQRQKQAADKRRQDTDDMGDVVKSALQLKNEYQGDYEHLRKRLTDQDEQLILLRQRIAMLEEENRQLHAQLAALSPEKLPEPVKVRRPRKPSAPKTEKKEES